MFEQFKNFVAGLTVKSGIPLSTPAAFDLFSPVLSHSAIPVTAETAMRCAPVNAGVRLISESIATLDACVHLDTPNGREKVIDHPAARLLRRPNPWTGSTEFFRQLVTDLILQGNGLALVARVREEPRELYRIDPRACSITVDTATGEPSYAITMQPGGTRELTWRDAIHLRNLSIDGNRGLGLLQLGAEVIGLALVLERHCATMFGQGARPAGVLEVPGRLDQAGFERLRSSFSQLYHGAANSGRTAILESGVKFSALQLASTDSQFLENRRFAVHEVARLLNIPPVLIGDLENSSLNISETLAQLFLDRTITPILEIAEDSLELTLLTPEEREAGYCIEFDTTNFVRSDLEKRFAAYKSGIESGVLLLNEARDREGLAPVEGGDQPMRSVQTIPLAPNAAAPSAPAPGSTAQGGQK